MIIWEYFLKNINNKNYIKGWTPWNSELYPEKIPLFSKNQAPLPEMNPIGALYDENKKLQYVLNNDGSVVKEPQSLTQEEIDEKIKKEKIKLIKDNLAEIIYNISENDDKIEEILTEIKKL